MNVLNKIVNDLKVTLEEDLAGENTSKETISNIDGFVEIIIKLWQQYKQENNLI